ACHNGRPAMHRRSPCRPSRIVLPSCPSATTLRQPTPASGSVWRHPGHGGRALGVSPLPPKCARPSTVRSVRPGKRALTPAAVQGHHDHLGALPDAAVDVIHRVVTDPGRLSWPWFTAIMATGLSAEQYVEILGTLVALVSIDSFCRGIGVPLHP